MNIGHRIAVIVLGACTGACALLAPREDITVYAPALTQLIESKTDRSFAPTVQLVVEQPHAIAPFDGTRIVVMPTPGEVQFYKSVRWRDSVPVMLQDLLLQAFRQTADFASATPSIGTARSDFILYSNIEAFQAEYRNATAPTVVIRLTVQLQRTEDAKIVGTRTFTVGRESAGAATRAVFLAYQGSLEELFSQVISWTQASVAAVVATPADVERERR